jgi:hypothetical protein
MTEALDLAPAIRLENDQRLEAVCWKRFLESERVNRIGRLLMDGVMTIAVYDIPDDCWHVMITDEDYIFWLYRECADKAEAIAIFESVGDVVTDEWIIRNGFIEDEEQRPLVLKNGSTKYEEGRSDSFEQTVRRIPPPRTGGG